MGEAISAILPPAIGAAISPIPIIAVILMLFTARARTNAPVFAVGWALGLLVVTALAYLLSDSQDVATDDDGSNFVFILKAAIGILLLFMAVKQWKGRPKEGQPPTVPPKWMQGIDTFTPGKAFGLAFLLGGPNPKNLLLSIAAGTTIAQLGTTGSAAWVAILAYVLIATIPVLGPVLYYFVAGKSAEARLDHLKNWLNANNATVMTVLFVIFGFTLLSDGLQGLFA